MKYSDISSKLIVRQYVIILYLLFPFIINGQLIIKPIDGQDVTPEKIIEDIFLGQGVEIININYEGLDVAAGIFENGSDYIGLDKGFILSTGDVRSASENASVEADGGFGQDDVMDEDLEELANINIRDVVKYEITFIPISDTLRFNYVFAYEDINLACLSTNDAFGFFIKGPNPDGGNYDNKNIALIPDPDNPGQFLDIPVSINTVNNGIAPDPETEVCFLDYSDYFNETDPNSPPVYDGYLDIFPAEVSVIPCEEYTIKIVLGDGKDDQGDSAVFLEEKSFSTNFLTVKNNNPGLNGGISEGCQAGNIELIINGARNINYQISLRALDDISLPDIALPGIDYEDIPENISIPPGQNSVELPLVALPDGLIEDTEFIYLEVSTGICNIDTLIFPITENTLSSLSLSDSLHNCFNDRDTIFASIDDLTDNDIRSFQSPQSFIINNNQEVISPIVVSGIEEEKLSPNLITNICIDQLYHTRLNDLDIFLQAPGGQILELSTRNGNRVNNESQIDTFINTCFNVSASDLINNGNSILGEMDLSNPTYTGQYTPEGDFDSWLSTESPSNGTYNLIVRDPINEFSGELTSWSISFMLDYEVTYNWFPTNGAQNCNCDSLIFQLGNSQYYYLEVTDTYGCANRDSVWVEVDPLPQTPDIINCESTSTSQVTFSWDQTPDFYEYQIRINDDPTWITTNSFVELLNGYKVTSNDNQEFIIDGLLPEEEINIFFRAINENGCLSLIQTVSCQSLPCEGNVPVIEDIIINQPLCDDVMTVPVEIIATDEDMPLTYRINLNGSFTIENTTGIFDQIPQGTWTVRVIDSQGCGTLDTIMINDPLPISLIANIEKITCHNDSNGIIEVNAFGAFPPFEYAWSDSNSSDNRRTNLGEGFYSVTATDQMGCTKTAFFTLDNPALIEYEYIQIDTIDCIGSNLGTATLEIEGGIQPYSIVWSDMSTGLVRTGQMPGTEYFTITDGNNCIIIDSSEIIQRSSFDVSSIANDILCFTDTVGTANVTATNGSAPYSFIWDNGEIGPNPVMLHAGVNTVTITDNGNCEVIHQVNINSPPKITIDFSPTAPSCIGSDDGSLSIDIEGGVGAPYAINWFNGNDTELVNNLESGDFCVTVSDATGCEETSCYFLDNPQRITVQESITSVNCSGNCSGAIQLETFGGSGNFNFEWSGPNNYSSMDQNISDLCPGNYIVTVSEILNPNCSETFSYVINMESELEAFIQTNRFISCFGGADGILIGIPFGGVPDYTYTWSSNVTSSNGNAAQNLSAGIYELTITDANGCESIAIDTLTQPDSLTLSFTNVDIVCYGESTGSSRVAIEGGTPDYIINWQNGETSTSIVNVPSQSYSITVTDRLGCTTVDETLVNEPPDSIMINAQIEGVTCFEGSDGRINVFTENTAEPVMYSIDNINFKFDRTFIGLSAGVYTIYVIDDNGCSQEMDINVEESLPLDLDLGEDLVVFFGEEANLNVAVNNNSNDLSYVWNSPNDSVTFSCQDCPNPIVSNITSSFTANVLVTDENGCTGREVINVFVDQEDQIDVPTIFTPNNDNINDRLNIFGSPDIRGVNFKVYSRWGELLFESTDFVPNDPLNGWDGTVNGSPASSGTYTWTAEYILENNDRAFKSGQTYLQR